MCRVLGVSPGGYYARLQRPLSARARADAALGARITEIHRRSRATYGADRAAKPPPELVERNFAAAAPNRLWVADISAP